MANPKTVQESSLFRKAINTVYQKGLKTEAYNKALKNMGNDIASKVVNEVNGYKSDVKYGKQLYDQVKASEVLFNKAVKNSSKKISGTPEHIKQVQQIAKNKAYRNSGYTVQNIREAESYYAKALLATKAQLGMNTLGNMAEGYFLNPLMQQQYLTAGIRAGLGIGTIGGTVGLGVVGSNLISNAGSYNNDYYDNLKNQDDNGIQNY